MSEVADNPTEYTERDVFEIIRHHLGIDHPTKEQARAGLFCRIQQEPSLLAMLPETLLDKLGIKHDQVFDAVDISLASRIGARCARRILWP